MQFHLSEHHVDCQAKLFNELGELFLVQFHSLKFPGDSVRSLHIAQVLLVNDKALKSFDRSHSFVSVDLVICKQDKSGESSNFICFAKILVHCAVNLSNFRLSLESLGQLVPNRGKAFAVAAPRSVELDKPRLRLQLQGFLVHNILVERGDIEVDGHNRGVPLDFNPLLG